MKRFLWVLLPLMLPSLALADNAWQYSKRVERSMVVTGMIEVKPDGSVLGFTLDKQDMLLPKVIELIDKTLPGWKFKPILVNGKPAPAKAAMSIRIVADKLDGDRYAMSVRGASFGNDEPSLSPSYKKVVPPEYPEEALQARVGGTVYAVAWIDRQGMVAKVAVNQVDLRAIGPERIMERLRENLAQAAIKAIEKFTFNMPTSGQWIEADHWNLRIPVNFEIAYDSPRPTEEYGHWDAYVPGPVNPISWAKSNSASDNRADAIPNNGLAFQDDQRFVLLNPPDKG